MEIQHSKHVKIVCDLNIGDKVRTDNWGRQLDNKVWTVQGVRKFTNCQSGFMVKIDGYDNLLDSDWLDKVSDSPDFTK